jgi:hypothetical protein
VLRDGRHATRVLSAYEVLDARPAALLEVELTTGEYISGQVTDAVGEPIPSAALVAQSWLAPPTRSVADEDGRFELGPFAYGAAVGVEATADGFGPGSAAQVIAPARDVLIPLERRGVLRGRILEDATEEPVERFRIAFHRRSGTFFSTPYPGERDFDSRDGRFEWSDLQPGAWNLTLFAPGYQPAEVLGVTIPPDGATQEITIRVVKGRSVEGFVFDRDCGAGFASATVWNGVTTDSICRRRLRTGLRSVTSD